MVARCALPWLAPALALATATGCAGALAGPTVSPVETGAPAFDWRLPPGFPIPRVPTDNPIRPAKVELGRHLFYDRRLSGNGTYSCASCHRQELAFTDGRARALGSTGQLHERSAMSLANAAYGASLTWADPEQTTLEAQMLVPMLGEDPVELGMPDAPTRSSRGWPRTRSTVDFSARPSPAIELPFVSTTS